jgi:hypothetical protein
MAEVCNEKQSPNLCALVGFIEVALRRGFDQTFPDHKTSSEEAHPLQFRCWQSTPFNPPHQMTRLGHDTAGLAGHIAQVSDLWLALPVGRLS